MLEKMVRQYYANDEVSEILLGQLEDLVKKSEAVMDTESINTLRSNGYFHDWYVKSISIQCKTGGKECWVTLSKRGVQYRIVFSGITSFSMFGEMVSAKAEYPGKDDESSIAQVLAIWIDYQECFTCCLLFDTERYMLFETANILVRK